ncbi:hypothetical protein X975_00189, partial [Stegodyphus mimosarum]
MAPGMKLISFALVFLILGSILVQETCAMMMKHRGNSGNGLEQLMVAGLIAKLFQEHHHHCG